MILTLVLYVYSVYARTPKFSEVWSVMVDDFETIFKQIRERGTYGNRKEWFTQTP